MGSRGPQRTPTTLLKISGSSRAVARERQGEPQPDSATPDMPEWVADHPDIRRLWIGTIDRLVKMGVASHTDTRAIERYVRALFEWHEARVFLDAAPASRTYETVGVDGEVTYGRVLPQVKIMKDLNDLLLRLEREFGLTPSARASLTTNATPINDKRGSFLDKRSRSTS